MALFPLSDLLTTWADGISKALRVKSETQLTGSSVSLADGQSNNVGVPKDSAGNSILPATLQYGFNGSTWDRWRNNTEGTLLASAERTANTTSPYQVNYNARGVIVTLYVSAASGTGGLILSIRTIDPASNWSIVLLPAPSAITTTGRYAYCLYPGASASGTIGNALVNSYVAAPLPRSWYVVVSHKDVSPYTYSVGYQLIV